MLAMVGCGRYDSVKACADALVSVRETVLPDPEIAALAADLSTGLARLQDAFAEVQVIFDDAQNAFDDMQLPETGAEETEEEA